MKEDEIRLAEFLVNQYLKRQNGVVSSKEILKFINGRIDRINGYLNINIKTIGDVKLRELINYIRKEKISKHGELLSNSKGYFLSTDKDEILEYIAAWEIRLQSQRLCIRSMNERTPKYQSKKGLVSAKVIYKHQLNDGKDLFDSL